MATHNRVVGPSTVQNNEGEGIGDTRERCALDPRRPFIALCLALLVAACAAVFPATASAATKPHYDLQVSLNFSAATLDVVQKTALRNNTGVDLPDLVFQVTPAYFDSFSLQSARVDGQEVAASREGTVLTLALNSPLAAGAGTEAELRYQLRVPVGGGRFGRSDGIVALGNWFPVLSVYGEEWDRHQYVDVGDAFYTEVADFNVTVASDVPVAIAASGPSAGQEGNRQSFHAEGLRDFAMAISNRYQTRSREVDGVQISAYGPSPARLELYLAEAARTLHWYSTHLVPYPYPTFTIAEVSAPDSVPTAQEYPALIMVYPALGADGGGTGSYSEYTVGHEVAHQWFYSLVGDDQVHDPWLDEAMASYVDLLFYRDQSPRSFDYYMGRNLSGYRSRAAAGGDRPVNTTIYDYPDDLPYFDIVYRKGAVFLDKLRGLMGDDRFLGLLRDYLQTYSNKVAFPRAFLDMAYTRVGPDLPPLVSQHFSYGAFAGGNGYQLEVTWPDQLTASGSATLSYRAGFPVAEAKVWLDNRLLYRGSGDGAVKLSLDGVEEGEYVLRLDLLDSRGALYQRAQRVKVAPQMAGTPLTPTLSEGEGEPNSRPHPVELLSGGSTPLPSGEGGLSPWESVGVRVLALLGDAVRGLDLPHLP
ncbi:MAG: M1 family metallopeptidase [Chloroflexi bacterium]|nr:M1 family metallopeptidase [Chloroflexota bacterium]